MYAMFSIILLSSLTAYVEEITGNFSCGFRRKRSTIDHILHIFRMLEKKRENKGTVHLLFIHIKKPTIHLPAK